MTHRPKSRRRGRTRKGRLRLLDHLLKDEQLHLPGGPRLVAVDVGVGDDIATTVELLEALKTSRRSEKVSLFGVENDPDRAARLRQQISDSCLEIVTGTFSDLVKLSSPLHLVRVMNVLRGYRLDEVREAQEHVLAALAPGGLLVEGSSDTQGHVLSAHLWRKLRSGGRRYEGLIMATDFTRGFAPLMFRDVLPRDLRRHALPPEPIGTWLFSWQSIVDDLRARGWNRGRAGQALPLRGSDSVAAIDREHENRALFVESLSQLAQKGPETTLIWARWGVALWTPPTPSGRSDVLVAVD